LEIIFDSQALGPDSEDEARVEGMFAAWIMERIVKKNSMVMALYIWEIAIAT
jgi:hypothetical protein